MIEKLLGGFSGILKKEKPFYTPDQGRLIIEQVDPPIIYVDPSLSPISQEYKQDWLDNIKDPFQRAMSEAIIDQINSEWEEARRQKNS